jgi:xanthine/uracil permease
MAQALLPAATATAERGIFDVGINEKLPLNQLLILGFQNVFGMPGMFVFPGLFGRAFNMSPEQIAYLYGMIFLVSGFTTCFQSVGLLRLPITQGPYVGSFVGLLVLGQLPDAGLAVAFGSFFIACVIWAVLAIPVRNMSFIALFGKFFENRLISGVMVILSMMQIAIVSMPNWIGGPQTPGFPLVNFAAGLISAVIFIGVTIWGGLWLRRAALLSALILGTVFYACFIPVSLAPVASVPWLVVPKFFPFGFAVRWDAVLVFVLALVPASIGSMALYHVVAGWGNEPITPARMSEGCFAAAIGSALGAMLGTFSMQIYPDNVGLLRTTRVGSRYATFAAGITLLVLGCCVKFDMLLVLVPVVVISAAATILFGIVMVHGIHLLHEVDWNDRNLVVGGSALMIGLGGLFVPPEALQKLPLLFQLILKQSAVTGGLTLFVLHWLLNRGQTGSVEQK